MNKELIESAKKGDLSEVRRLLDRGADVHVWNDAALRLAAEGGHEPVVKLLLDRGADVRADNDAALRLAAEGGHEPVAKLLLDRGADVHAMNDAALRLAAEGGHESTVRLLKKHMKKPQAASAAAFSPSSLKKLNTDGRSKCAACGGFLNKPVPGWNSLNHCPRCE